MMVFMENTIVLTDAERMELNQRAASRSGRADDARRARLMLLLEAGRTWAAICDKLDCNDAFIDRWSKRFREERLAGLFSRKDGGSRRPSGSTSEGSSALHSDLFLLAQPDRTLVCQDRAR